MQTIETKLSTPKEVTEVGLALKQILEATAVALGDGFQPGNDIPVIMSSAFGSLVNAISGIQEIGAEVKESPLLSILGAIIPVAEGIEALLKVKKA